jgi:PTH2 family peptidyl-tRNA hydrolase
VTEDRLKIIVNDRVTMSRGKYAAQAVHAALMAFGVHHGGPVIVLGGSPAEIEECAIQIRDAGRTEVEQGTLTAGAAEIPTEPEPDHLLEGMVDMVERVMAHDPSGLRDALRQSMALVYTSGHRLGWAEALREAHDAINDLGVGCHA